MISHVYSIILFLGLAVPAPAGPQRISFGHLVQGSELPIVITVPSDYVKAVFEDDDVLAIWLCTPEDSATLSATGLTKDLEHPCISIWNYKTDTYDPTSGTFSAESKIESDREKELEAGVSYTFEKQPIHDVPAARLTITAKTTRYKAIFLASGKSVYRIQYMRPPSYTGGDEIWQSLVSGL